VRLLLDTNVLICWVAGLPVSAQAYEAIADPANDATVSVLALWEMATKRAVGKVDLHIPSDEALAEIGFSVLAITTDDARRVATLPLHHRDPFDRMLIAQAIGESLTLVTRDRTFAAYGVTTIVA